MKKSPWYMIVYDIADPKRLKKVHKIMKTQGLPVQQSVFFFQGYERNVVFLLDKIEKVMALDKDDLRAYPVSHPKNVWSTGGVLEAVPLINISSNTYHEVKAKQKKSSNKKQKKSWLKRVLSKFSKKT
ncbi:CRISPR-associated protein Cas2 [Candidatus Magnetomorum sp. HK-1]|nr:CRISPR-associated protein Cas2 [Candidatus Magnetomorum sp. HK-1]